MKSRVKCDCMLFLEFLGTYVMFSLRFCSMKGTQELVVGVVELQEVQNVDVRDGDSQVVNNGTVFQR